jgi:hypothetical protein
MIYNAELCNYNSDNDLEGDSKEKKSGCIYTVGLFYFTEDRDKIAASSHNMRYCSYHQTVSPYDYLSDHDD